MTKNQKGFGVVELILVVVIVVLLGALGWMVYTNSQKDDAANTDTSQNTIKTDADKDPTSDWYKFTSAGNEYTMKVADGWKLHNKGDKSEPSLYGVGDMALVKGTKGSVTPSPKDAEGEFACGVYLDWMAFKNEKDFDQNSESMIGDAPVAFKTDAGIDVRKDSSSRDDTKNYLYHVLNDKKSMITVGYTTCADGEDNHEVVEQVVKTIKFND